MTNKKNTVAVLGSTGSVGVQTMDVIRSLGLEVSMISAGANAKLAAEQAREFKPLICAMEDEKAAAELKILLDDTYIKIYSGTDGICDGISESKADTAIVSIAGYAGLEPSVAAAKSGMRLAMANKEAIIVAGAILKNIIDETKTHLIPVDSEHCAVFQCLESNRVKFKNEIKDEKNIKSGLAGDYYNNINRILLTASGGPFRGKTRDELQNVTAKEALAHPTWKMGKKITIDSATLMNKGFEVIEAVRLFGVSPDQVEVVIHPQSIIHSMAEYIDCGVIAQMGAPDMRSCIQYALTYPERVESRIVKRLNFAEIKTLTFENPDTETFRAIPLAYDAIRKDGVFPAVLVASDEEAVDAFINGKIGFLDITDIVEKVMSETPEIKNPSLCDISEADIWARERTKSLILK